MVQRIAGGDIFNIEENKAAKMKTFRYLHQKRLVGHESDVSLSSFRSPKEPINTREKIEKHLL